MKPILYKNRIDYKKHVELLEEKKREIRQLENDLNKAKSELEQLPERHIVEARRETGMLTAEQASGIESRIAETKQRLSELEDKARIKREALKFIEMKVDSTIRRIKADVQLANKKTAAFKSKELLKAMDNVRDILGQLRAFVRQCDTGFDIIAAGAEVSGPSGQEYVSWRDAELKKIDAILNKPFDLDETEQAA